MSGSLNKVILIGNLGKDPELRYTQDNKKIVSFSLATSESWKDKVTSERKDKTEWHQIVIFNERLCDIANQYLHKGSKVYIEGQLQTRKWQDKSGNEHYKTEIILQQFRGELTILDSKKENEYSHTSDSIEPHIDKEPSALPSTKPFNYDLNDDVPF